MNVYEIMSKPVVSLDPDMDVRHCARMFDQFGLSSVPVIENGKQACWGLSLTVSWCWKGLCELID